MLLHGLLMGIRLLTTAALNAAKMPDETVEINDYLGEEIRDYTQEKKMRQYLGYDRSIAYSIDHEYGQSLIGFEYIPEWTERRELESKIPQTVEELATYNTSPRVFHNVFCARMQKEPITPEYRNACCDIVRQYLKDVYGCRFNLEHGYYNMYTLQYQNVPFSEALHHTIIAMCRDFTAATQYKALPDREGGIAA